MRVRRHSHRDWPHRRAGLSAVALLIGLHACAVPQSIRAQTPAADSLKLLLSRTKSPFVRSDIQAALAREIALRDLDATCSYADAALRSAEAAGYKRGIGRALLEKGWCSHSRKDFGAAAAHFSRALEVAESARDADTRARALIGCAWIAKRVNNTAELASMTERALALCIENWNTGTAKFVLGHAAQMFRNIANDTTVLRLQKAYLHACETKKDTASIIHALRLVGNSEYAAASWYKAVQAYERCAKLGRGRAYSNDVTWALNSAGNAYVNLGNLPDAMSAFERGYAIAEEADDLRLMAALSRNIARMHTMRGDFTQSMSSLRRSLKHAERLGDTALTAGYYFLLGIEHDLAGKKDEALPYLAKCVEMRERIGDRNGVATALEIMGATCTNKGDFARASIYLEAARQKADSIGDPKLQALVCIGLGRNYRDQGDLRLSIEYYKRAAILYRKARAHSDEHWAIQSTGDLLSRLGQYDSAMVYFDSSYVMACRLGEKARIRDFQATLVRHHARRGDFKSAYALLKKVDATLDSAYNEENYRQINELSALSENERKERQIASLEKEKVAAELAMRRHADELEHSRHLSLLAEQAIRMLERENQLRDLVLQRDNSELALRASVLSLGQARNEDSRREFALRSAQYDSETLLRNSIIGILLLLLAGTGFAARSMHEKKRAATLHAESAMYRAQAAELRANKLRSEGERREREIQQAYAARLMGAQEQERERIAGLLHDGVGQELISVGNMARLALQDAVVDNQSVQEILRIASETLEDVRLMSRNLRPVQLERLGLTICLRSMISAVSENTGLTIEYQLEEIDGLLPSENEIDVYRVVQEALNNVVTHSKAESAAISVNRDGCSIFLTVRDNGRGFDPGIATAGNSLGLQGMAERISMLGGELEIDSSLGRGTILRATIPFAVMPAGSGTDG